MTDLERLIIRHEGLKLKPYIDTVGKWTIGVGHNLSDKPLSKDAVLFILADDIHDAVQDAKSCCSVYDELSAVRQMVLVDMAFNLGKARLMAFVRFWNAIHKSDWDEAGEQMLDSKWAIQVGSRAIELALMMRTNTLPMWKD
jgi:lysozyme